MWVGQLQMGFQYVVFLLYQATFWPSVLKMVVEVKASGPSHVLKPWLG